MRLARGQQLRGIGRHNWGARLLIHEIPFKRRFLGVFGCGRAGARSSSSPPRWRRPPTPSVRPSSRKRRASRRRRAGWWLMPKPRSTTRARRSTSSMTKMPPDCVRTSRLGAPHRIDLRRANGTPASSWPIFAYSSSFSISSSPILAWSRRLSSSRAVVARSFRPAGPAARN